MTRFPSHHRHLPHQDHPRACPALVLCPATMQGQSLDCHLGARTRLNAWHCGDSKQIHTCRRASLMVTTAIHIGTNTHTHLRGSSISCWMYSTATEHQQQSVVVQGRCASRCRFHGRVIEAGLAAEAASWGCCDSKDALDGPSTCPELPTSSSSLSSNSTSMLPARTAKRRLLTSRLHNGPKLSHYTPCCTAARTLGFLLLLASVPVGTTRCVT